MTTTPDIDIDDEVAQTPEQLLVDLGELHTRTLVSPLPKHPAAMGWQATAGSMAAGFARALHALNEIAPEKAAELTVWFQGPFEDGPDPEEHTDWLERHVARGPELLEQWVEDGRRMARDAVKNTEAWEKENQDDRVTEATAEDVHTYFGLSYANYLVLPRTLLQCMPDEWQTKFVRLLGEMDEAFQHVPQAEAYDVQAGTEHIVNEMGHDLLEEAGITEDWYDEPVPEDLSPFDLTEWKAEHEKAAPTYFDAAGRELDPNERVFQPGEDPVPHYNRGRTRVEPRLSGAE